MARSSTATTAALNGCCAAGRWICTPATPSRSRTSTAEIAARRLPDVRDRLADLVCMDTALAQLLHEWEARGEQAVCPLIAALHLDRQVNSGRGTSGVITLVGASRFELRRRVPEFSWLRLSCVFAAQTNPAEPAGSLARRIPGVPP